MHNLQWRPPIKLVQLKKVAILLKEILNAKKLIAIIKMENAVILKKDISVFHPI